MRIVIRSLVVPLFVLSIEATALGQARCAHYVHDEDGFAVVVTRYELDAEGRITAIDYENDAAAFASRTVLRYAQTGELVEERLGAIAAGAKQHACCLALVRQHLLGEDQLSATIHGGRRRRRRAGVLWL